MSIFRKSNKILNSTERASVLAMIEEEATFVMDSVFASADELYRTQQITYRQFTAMRRAAQKVYNQAVR